MMRKTAKATPITQILIPPLVINNIMITLEGTSPLISHKWSLKAQKQMQDKQAGIPVIKMKREPEQDFFDSLYWVTEKPDDPSMADLKKAKFGFPAAAFKHSAVEACTQVKNMKKTDARKAFHIDGEIIEIISPTPPIMRTDPVRVGQGKTDLRYRGSFPKWRVTLSITYNKDAITPDQLVNLFNIAGFAVGVGEWRPQKNGEMGRFQVMGAPKSARLRAEKGETA